MLTLGFERIALVQFLMGALVLGLIEHAQAQPVNPQPLSRRRPSTLPARTP